MKTPQQSKIIRVCPEAPKKKIQNHGSFVPEFRVKRRLNFLECPGAPKKSRSMISRLTRSQKMGSENKPTCARKLVFTATRRNPIRSVRAKKPISSLKMLR